MPKPSWDQETVEENTNTNFEPLPRGKYPCIIAQIEEKKTKAGTGSYYEVELEIVKGDFARRKFWARLNVNNPSEVAQNIGRGQFKSLCKCATGKETTKTTEALHGKHVVVLASIEQSADRGPQNRVDGFQSPEEWKSSGAVTPSREDMAESSSPTSTGRSSGAAKANGKAKGTQADFDDDIPF